MAPPSPRTLPAELMSLVYASLSQPDLLAAAAVSSWWRTNAVNDRNYYRAWTVVFPNPAQLSGSPRAAEYADLDKFVSIVDNSETCQYLLGLSIFIDLEDLYRGHDSEDDRSSNESHLTLSFLGDGSDEDGTSTDSSPTASSPEDDEARLERNKTTLQTVVIPALLRALPRVVVLILYPCLYSVPLFWDCLASPAPVLRALEIRAGRYNPFEQLETPPLPAHFLAGNAPRLQEVYLIMAVISPSTPSFPSVHRLRLAYPYASPTLDAVFACFRNVKDLAIECIPDDTDVSSDEANLFSRLDALRLGSHNLAQLMRALPDMIHVPFIKYSSVPVYCAMAVLNVPGPLSVCLSENLHDEDAQPMIRKPYRFSHLNLEVASPTAVRPINSGASFKETIELLNMSRCAERITQLTIDDRHVRSLIQICGTMPALRTLRIVLITWHTLGPEAQLTEAEATLYREPHVRNDCQCLGGPFSDWHDGGAPDSTCRPAAWPALHTVELCASRPHSFVPAAVLGGLADALPARALTLVLSNRLSLADDAPSALFCNVRSADSAFCASLVCVGRAATLLAAAANKKVSTRQRMNMILRFKGPNFHCEECDRRARSEDDSDEGSESGSQPE